MNGPADTRFGAWPPEATAEVPAPIVECSPQRRGTAPLPRVLAQAGARERAERRVLFLSLLLFLLLVAQAAALSVLSSASRLVVYLEPERETLVRP